MKKRPSKKPYEKSRPRTRLSLTLLFSALLFMIFLVTMLVVVAITLILSHYGILVISGSWSGASRFIIYLALAAVIFGTLLAFGAGNIPLWPVNYLVYAMNRLAEGDYSVRLKTNRSWGEISFVKETITSFNKLAEELNNTQMLRMDFVNNFSHEFKTPIVSINGFAELLLHGNLSAEEQREYLAIIASESARLAHMTNDILDMTRIENQSILTNVTEFNLSELIRNCVLLLEQKWSVKNIIPEVDFEEYEISANQDMLQHVFINLIDNAIKFSPEDGVISIRIAELQDEYHVSVENHGETIAPEVQERIFDKFFQGDRSHSTVGNGIGLAVVKRAVELHHGHTELSSGNGTTIFTVILPISQYMD